MLGLIATVPLFATAALALDNVVASVWSAHEAGRRSNGTHAGLTSGDQLSGIMVLLLVASIQPVW